MIPKKIFIKIIAENIENKKRIDSFLNEKLKNFTRSKIQELIQNGKVIICNKNQDELVVHQNNFQIKNNDIILIKTQEEVKTTDLLPLNIPIDILYEDEYLIVINKQPYLTVHPGAGNMNNTLVNGLISYFGKNNLSTINGNFRPGIVHRLDKDTSGVMVVAKDDRTHFLLAKQFEEHSIVRKYRALVFGKMKISSLYVENYIVRSNKNRLKYEVSKINKGKIAKTKIKSLNNYKNLISLLEFELLTGRTHQIRVHSSFLKMPILGDKIYFDPNITTNVFRQLDDEHKHIIEQIDRQLLNAFYLEFFHPHKNKKLTFEIKDWEDMINIYKSVGFDNFI